MIVHAISAVLVS